MKTIFAALVSVFVMSPVYSDEKMQFQQMVNENQRKADIGLNHIPLKPKTNFPKERPKNLPENTKPRIWHPPIKGLE